MKKFRSSHLYINVLVLGGFFCVQNIIPIDHYDTYISPAEIQEIIQNSNERYVYLGKEYSQLYETIARVHALEEEDDSILALLKNHIDEGCVIGLYDDVLDALQYAEQVIENNVAKVTQAELQDVDQMLDVVVNQVANHLITIEADKLSAVESLGDLGDAAVKRSCGSGPCPYPLDPCCATLPKCRIVKVREKLEAFQNAKFKKNVDIDGKLKVRGKAKFEDDVKFKEDVLIEGDLTVDGTVTFNGPVTGITITEGFIESLTVTDLVVLSCIDNLCIETLSVTDLVVLSCIDNLCVTNLSATNAFIQNLSIGDITILSCLDSLCVLALSAVDESVSGTLSVNNEIVTNISATNLSATNAFIQNLSVGDIVISSCLDSLCVLALSVVDESVSGTLSVNNEFVNNLSATNAFIQNLSVGDITVLSCLDSLCVLALSAVDESVSGTLSVNNEIVTNISATNLSATNAFIQNLSVGDIVIASCLDSLCVLALSAVDESVSGTLSVNNEIVANISATNLSATNGVIQNLSVTDLVVLSCIDNLCVINLSAVDFIASTIDVLCNLSVGCDIIMNNTNGAGIGNIFKGANSFIHNAGTDNTFIGINAGNFVTTGAENIGMGVNALNANTTGFNDVALGASSMNANTVGANDVAVGAFSLFSNTTGNDNVAVGSFSLAANTSGSGNTAVGFNTGFSLAPGNNNVFIGNNAAANLDNGFTNIIIGYNSGILLLTGDDNVYIANAGISSESGIIRIGTPATHTTAFLQGVFGSTVGATGIGVFVDAAGQLGTIVSSQDFKRNIKDMGLNSENIYKLRPVTFMYKGDKEDTVQYGLIAEEVEQVLPELVVHDEEGKPYTVRYHLLPQMILNELQKLNTIVQEQAATISELRADNVLLKTAINNVLNRLN